MAALALLMRQLQNHDPVLAWPQYGREGAFKSLGTKIKLVVVPGESGLRTAWRNFRAVLVGTVISLPWFHAHWYQYRWLVVMAALSALLSAYMAGVTIVGLRKQVQQQWTWHLADNTLICEQQGQVIHHIVLNAEYRISVTCCEIKAFSYRRCYLDIILLYGPGYQASIDLLRYWPRGEHLAAIQQFKQQFEALCQQQKVGLYPSFSLKKR